MPEQVIAAIMQRRNPRTGQNYTREEAERILSAHMFDKHHLAGRGSSGETMERRHKRLGHERR
jgi:hypothetical protein